MQQPSSAANAASEQSQPVSASTTDNASPTTSPSGRDRKKAKQQPRQLLSCSKCRERKVKCDRTKPCSACCARGHPKECHFILGEGTTFGPIQQALELRRLRGENQRLKERLLEAKVNVSGDSDDGGPSSGQPTGGSRFSQRKFGADEPGDTIYFGTPGFASVTTDLLNAALHPTSRSISHPKSAATYEIFSGDNPTVYPFPSIWTSGTWIQGLFSCLQPWQDIAELVVSFSEREDSIVYPRPAFPLSLSDAENFMSDFENNANTYPDLLAFIFASLACEMRRREFDSIDERKKSSLSLSDAALRRNMFLSASMQALRQTTFISQPTLLSIQAMILMCIYLSSDGRALEAWTVLGTTIRMAQAVGLHRNPKVLEPLPSLRESGVRKKLWWQLLNMDQQYSMALGRPLGISAIGDCPFPDPLTTDAAMVRLIECVDQLTMLGRQIIGTAPLINHRINGFAEKLQTLLDTIPEEIQFSDSWTADPSQAPESLLDEYTAVIHLQVHGYLLLLHKLRLEPSQLPTPSTGGSFEQNMDTSQARINETSNQRTLASMIESCRHVLEVFCFLFTHRQSVLTDWAIKQQTLTAAAVLLQEMQQRIDLQCLPLIESVLNMFHTLSHQRIDTIANFAATRMGDLLAKVREIQHQQQQQQHQQHLRRQSIATVSTAPSPFPDFYAAPAAVRRDSQISWLSPAGSRPTTSDLKREASGSPDHPLAEEQYHPLQQQQVQHHNPYPPDQQDPLLLGRRATVSGAFYPTPAPVATARFLQQQQQQPARHQLAQQYDPHSHHHGAGPPVSSPLGQYSFHNPHIVDVSRTFPPDPTGPHQSVYYAAPPPQAGGDVHMYDLSQQQQHQQKVLVPHPAQQAVMFSQQPAQGYYSGGAHHVGDGKQQHMEQQHPGGQAAFAPGMGGWTPTSQQG